MNENGENQLEETSKEYSAIVTRGNEVVRRVNIQGSNAWGVYGRLKSHYNTPGDNHNIDFHKGAKKYGNKI